MRDRFQRCLGAEGVTTSSYSFDGSFQLLSPHLVGRVAVYSTRGSWNRGHGLSDRAVLAGSSTEERACCYRSPVAHTKNTTSSESHTTNSLKIRGKSGFTDMVP